MLLRQLALDGSKGSKLEPRWIGPYLATKIKNNTTILRELKTGELVGRHHLNNIKIFIPREVSNHWERVIEQKDLHLNRLAQWKLSKTDPTGEDSRNPKATPHHTDATVDNDEIDQLYWRPRGVNLAPERSAALSAGTSDANPTQQ